AGRTLELEAPVHRAESGQIVEGMALGAPVLEIGQRDLDERAVPRRIRLPGDHETVQLRHRYRMPEHATHDAEDRGREADAEPEDHDGGRRQPRPAGQATERRAQRLREMGHVYRAIISASSRGSENTTRISLGSSSLAISPTGPAGSRSAPPTRRGPREKGDGIVSYTWSLVAEVRGVRGLTGRPLVPPKGTAAGDDLYRQIFESNRAVQLLIDPATARIVDANPAACRFYGYSHEELTSRKIADINALPPSEVTEALARAASGAQSRFHLQHRLASGEVRSVDVETGPVERDGRVLLYS